MNAWTPKRVDLPNNPVVGASETNVPVSAEFGITAGGANRGMVVCIKASSVSGTATAKLQTKVANEAYTDSKTAVLSNGMNYIKINPTDDSSLLPLLNVGRIVLTTAGASGATIELVRILQED